MPVSTLCRADACQLVVIDIQTRLTAAMGEADLNRVFKNTGVLLKAAGILRIPVSVTEQYPKGLGGTETEIAAQFPVHARQFTKTTFSCCGGDGFPEVLDLETHPQIVLAGMEAHVCVLQTALDLVIRGFQVFVVEDAVCSRTSANYRNALKRLRQAGAIIPNTESVLFEWLRDAKHHHFRAVSALVK